MSTSHRAVSLDPDALKHPLSRLGLRVYESPTFMTWLSFLTRSLTLLAVTPLVLTTFQTADIALWYLFSSIMTLQLLADLGFSPTFVRVISFAMGGADSHQLTSMQGHDVPASPRSRREANWSAIREIVATMRVVYSRLTLTSVLGLGVVGTLVVKRPITLSPDPIHAWLAWGVIVAVSCVVLRGNAFSAYLQGVNRIALVRRWEALTNLGSVLTCAIVLAANGGLLGLVIAHQSWLVLNVGRNWLLARYVENGRFRSFAEAKVAPHVLNAVWPNAWRSGIGVALGHAPMHFTGLIYAQVGTPGSVSMYMFSLALLTAIRSFSMAPFYSKVPLLARLRAEHRIVALTACAARGMRWSYWTFVVLVMVAAVAVAPALRLMGSNTQFVPSGLWALLGLGVFIERFGAMHLQLYSTTNHIVWHIANGVTGTLYVAASAVLFPFFGLYGFAFAHIVSVAGFYAWYSARRSYSVLDIDAWSFERRVVMAPAAAMGVFALLMVLRSA